MSRARLESVGRFMAMMPPDFALLALVVLAGARGCAW
jgi:hypothetical protein